MRLLLFSASVFYFLGLKLTSHFEINTHLLRQAEISKPKIAPAINTTNKPQETNPAQTPKDTTISLQVKKGQLTTPFPKNAKKQMTPSV